MFGPREAELLYPSKAYSRHQEKQDVLRDRGSRPGVDEVLGDCGLFLRSLPKVAEKSEPIVRRHKFTSPLKSLWSV